MKPYPALFAELLSEELSSLRQQMALTQEAMAEQLRISSRAYSDLERGRYAASAPTLLFFFSMLEADAQSALVQPRCFAVMVCTSRAKTATRSTASSGNVQSSFPVFCRMISVRAARLSVCVSRKRTLPCPMTER